MARSNLISATLAPEQRANILKCLTEAQEGLGFLINISTDDKRRLVKMGTRSVGYVDDCIAAFEEFKGLLPADLDLPELKRDRILYEDLMTLSVKVRSLNESLNDSIMALSSDMMMACNDGYATLQRSGKRENAVKMAVERISRRYKGNGRSKVSGVVNV